MMTSHVIPLLHYCHSPLPSLLSNTDTAAWSDLHKTTFPEDSPSHSESKSKVSQGPALSGPTSLGPQRDLSSQPFCFSHAGLTIFEPIFTPCSRAFVPAVPLPVMFFLQMSSGLTSLPLLGPSPSCNLLEMPSRSLPGTSHLLLLLYLSSKRLAPLEILYVWLIPLFLCFPQWSCRRRDFCLPFS